MSLQIHWKHLKECCLSRYSVCLIKWWQCTRMENSALKGGKLFITTVFVDTQLWKTKHPRKRFQNFHQSCVLSSDRIEIHQSQPLVWPSDLLYVMLAGCDWWFLIRSVDSMYDWRKFWKRFRGCFVFESRVSTKTVVKMAIAIVSVFVIC